MPDDASRRRDDGAYFADSDRWLTITLNNGTFFQECCVCGLAHRVHVRGVTELTVRWERLPGGIPRDEIDAAAVRAADGREEAHDAG